MNTVTNDIVEFICQFEGFSSTPYRDAVGIPTIGYGTITYPGGKKVTMKDEPITKDQALSYVKTFIERNLVTWINTNLPNLTHNQFAAIVSFTYNLGIPNLKDSTLFRYIRANKSCSEIQDAFMMWNKANHKILMGLTKRREAEGDLYCK